MLKALFKYMEIIRGRGSSPKYYVNNTGGCCNASSATFCYDWEVGGHNPNDIFRSFYIVLIRFCCSYTAIVNVLVLLWIAPATQVRFFLEFVDAFEKKRAVKEEHNPRRTLCSKPVEMSACILAVKQ